MTAADDLFHQARERAARLHRLPEATYRLQFHAGFTFQDARQIVPYLRELGITHCYASPYLRARPGSTHGYDIIDHSSLNPEIGTIEDYNVFAAALKENGLGQILDLDCRRDHPELFSTGEYLPLGILGQKADHVFAFARADRRDAGSTAIVAVPRLLARLIPDGEQAPLSGDVWKDTRLLLPRVDPKLRWHNIFTGERLASIEEQGQPTLLVAEVFGHFPVALLLAERANEST